MLMAAGGVVDTLCEMYKGTYMLTPSEQGPAKTVLTYDVTMVAKSAARTAELNSLVTGTILNDKLPHLQTVMLPPPAHHTSRLSAEGPNDPLRQPGLARCSTVQLRTPAGMWSCL